MSVIVDREELVTLENEETMAWQALRLALTSAYFSIFSDVP